MEKKIARRKRHRKNLMHVRGDKLNKARKLKAALKKTAQTSEVERKETMERLSGSQHNTAQHNAITWDQGVCALHNTDTALFDSAWHGKWRKCMGRLETGPDRTSWKPGQAMRSSFEFFLFSASSVLLYSHIIVCHVMSCHDMA